MRNGIMLAHPMSQAKLNKWRNPNEAIAQPKINGNRCRAFKDGDGVVRLYSSEGNEFVSVPHINEELNELMFSGMHLDGELYVHGMKVQKLRSIVSKTTHLDPDYLKVEYHVFDMIPGEKAISNWPNLLRLRAVEAWFGNVAWKHIKQVSWVTLDVEKSLQEVLSHYMRQDYEGIILRNPDGLYEFKRSGNLLKYKPKHRDYYQITGLLQAIDQFGAPKEMLGAVLLRDAEGNSFKAGAGCLTHAERMYAWEDRRSLIGQWAEIVYPELTERGVPFHPVLKNIYQTNPEEKEER